MTTQTRQAIRNRSKRLYPASRKNAAEIIRSLRKSFSRPSWMMPNAVPAMVRAMARECSSIAFLL